MSRMLVFRLDFLLSLMLALSLGLAFVFLRRFRALGLVSGRSFGLDLGFVFRSGLDLGLCLRVGSCNGNGLSGRIIPAISPSLGLLELPFLILVCCRPVSFWSRG